MAIIIPSTGRAQQCARLVERIYQTARTGPSVLVSVEPDDVKPYAHAQSMITGWDRPYSFVGMTWDQTGPHPAYAKSHVAAINRAARCALAERFIDQTEPDPKLIIKLDDDHWPLTVGWDQLYLNALAELGGTGVVYGNDLFQGERLPTVPGLSADIVRELGWYAPPQLGHWHCDDFWRELGVRAGRLKYLPDVHIEHRHPVPGKAPHDAVYAAGGLSDARIAADGAAWAEINAPNECWANVIEYAELAAGSAPTGSAPSQMDVWAGVVRELAENPRYETHQSHWYSLTSADLAGQPVLWRCGARWSDGSPCDRSWQGPGQPLDSPHARLVTR